MTIKKKERESKGKKRKINMRIVIKRELKEVKVKMCLK